MKNTKNKGKKGMGKKKTEILSSILFLLLIVISVSGDLGCPDCVRVDTPQTPVIIIESEETPQDNIGETPAQPASVYEHGLTVPLEPESEKTMSIMADRIDAPTMQAKVDRFVERSEDALGVDFDNLVPQSVERDADLWKAFYTQEYEGIPVHDSLVGVVVDDGTVVKTKTKYHEDIDAPTEPLVSLEEAVENAKEELGVDEEPLKTKLLIYPFEGEYYLTWEISFPLTIDGNEPHGWMAYADTQTGKTIHYYDSIVYDIHVNGTVTGLKYYPIHPNQTQKTANFTNGDVAAWDVRKNVFHTRTNATDESYLTLKEPLNLSNASWANLSFMLGKSWSCYWITCSNILYVEMSNTTSNESWETIATFWKDSYSFRNDPPLVYNISRFIGQGEVYLRFRGYSLEEDEGAYIDNITITTNNGVVFSDTAENTSNWNTTRFWISSVSVSSGHAGTTDATGFYDTNGAYGWNETVVEFKLDGDVSTTVYNFDAPYTFHSHYMNESGTYNWTINDTSDRQEESNVYYHIDRAYSFFNPCSNKIKQERLK